MWTKIIKYLSSKDVYGSLTLVNKRFQSLAIGSGVLRMIKVVDHDIIHDYFKEKTLNILTHSKAPIKLVCEISEWNYNIFEVISMAQNLKHLVLQKTPEKTDGNIIFEWPPKISKGDEFSMKFLDAFKHSKLEHLELEGYFVDPNAMIEITKIKTLKTFRISNSGDITISITPEVVNAFAQNENQLEHIEFDDFNVNFFWREPLATKEESNELITALNNLLNRKSNAMKSLKYITWDGTGNHYSSNFPLTNLRLCQNLDEFCGQLQPHDIEILAELPRLQKLKLRQLENPKYLLDNLNFDSLKYLSLTGTFETDSIICQELRKHNFPVLERLHIHVFDSDVVGLDEDLFLNLMSNATKLKSISISSHPYIIFPLSDQFMYNFFKNSNIFVSFKNKSFEEFCIEKDPIVFRKYNRMKKSFANWSSNNPEYS